MPLAESRDPAQAMNTTVSGVLPSDGRLMAPSVGPDADALGQALGRPPVHGVAVLDRQLARGLRAYLVVANQGEKVGR